MSVIFFSLWIFSLLIVMNINDFLCLIGRFLKKFLGPINVRAMRKDVQLKVKEEYNSYKVSFLNKSEFIDFELVERAHCLFV